MMIDHFGSIYINQMFALCYSISLYAFKGHQSIRE